MDIKKKILLGDKDIISKDNEDLFINLNLSSSFNDVINDKFENIFDVDKQFKKERNSSKNFKIYGTIDSTVTDCDNLLLEVFSTSGIAGLTNLITTISSTTLVYEEKNVYGKKRGKFIIDLQNYNNDFVFIKIPSNDLNYKDQIYTQQLIFKDSEGNFVEYGTQTIDIDNNGNTIEISNDFYFMFNKHWIKKSLLIIEEKPAKVFINSLDDFTNTNEFNVLADRVGIEISLDKPSPFGLEKVDLTVVTSTLDGSEITIVDAGNTVLPLPYTLSFSIGEQNKQLFFYSPTDNVQEFIENVVLGLDNFINVSTGSPLQHTVFVADTTARNKVKLNFQDVYQNRNYFTGRVYEQSSTLRYSFGMPAVLRNGLFFEGTPMEFYPSDNYVLKIKNVGINTILPININLGITEEKLFLANDEFTFNITQEYTNTQKHSIKLTFKDLNLPATNVVNYYSYQDGFKINGIPLVKYGYNFPINYSFFLALLTKTNPPSIVSPIDGWSYVNFETPFTVTADAANLAITITAKNPGTRLDLSSYGSMPDLFNVDSVLFDSIGVKAEVVDSFVYGTQKPLEIELGANFNNNLEAKYQFRIEKLGYDTMAFINSPIPASLNPNPYYLVSGLNTVLRNWNDSNSAVTYTHNNVTSNWGTNASATNPNFGSYKTGDVYINGMVLLSNQYLSNTLIYSSNPQGSNALNQSHAINSSGNFSHDFLPAPIIVIPETTLELSPYDVAQYGYLTILKPNFGTASSPPTGVGAERSFDFRTGNTNSYNTYYTNDYYNYGGFMWLSSSSFYSFGGTISSTNSITAPKALKTLLETGQSSPFISAQGLTGVGASLPAAYYNEFSLLYSSTGQINQQHVEGANTLSVIRLESQTPGIPFEINNIKEMKYISGPNIGQDYTKGSIFYIEARPNQTAGLTINLANNKMGGFSVTHP